MSDDHEKQSVEAEEQKKAFLAAKLEAFCDGVANNPSKAYCLTCGSYCFVFFLFIVLILGLGSTFFPFSNDVPLYLRDHVTQERADALTAGMDEADYSLDQPVEELRQSVESLGGDREDLTLEIVYLPRFGDMLESDLIAAVNKFEQRITAMPDYEKYCLKEYSQSEIELEKASNAEQIRIVNSLPHPCAKHHTIFWSCDPSLGVDCESLLSKPVGLMYCPKVGQSCSPTEMVVNDTFKGIKTSVYANSIPDVRTPAGLNSWNFLRLVDSQFGSGNQIVRAALTVFTFGVPFEGYKTVNDDADGQSDKLAEFLYDTYDSPLDGGGAVGHDGVSYLFNGHGMLNLFISKQLIADAMFMMASMLFVLFYIAFMTSSWWLSIMGMGQIVMSTAPAYMIYFAVFQQRYFGVFNMLCIFIILGIGADDIFVFLDTWEQSASRFDEAAHGKRLLWTWKHAGKAMLVTSLSTMFSFMSNANSSFPAIQTFGLFAAMLVLVNYSAVMIYYPTVVMLYTAKWAQVPFCFGLADKVSAMIDGTRKKHTRKVAPVAPDDNESGDVPVDDVDKDVPPPTISDWFYSSYTDGVLRARVVILAIFIALGVSLGITGAQIEADPDNPRFLPTSNNYQSFMLTKPAFFNRGGSDDSILIKFAWGFAAEPIDRAGTRATDTKNLGNPVWNPQFSMAKAANCILSICEAAEAKSDARKTGGYPDYPIQCFVADFKRWVDMNNGTSTWAAITGPTGDQDRFYDLMVLWLRAPSVISAWKKHIHGELVDNTPTLRFVMAELKLTATRSIDSGDGMALWGLWDDFMKEQYTKPPCLEVANEAAGWQSSLVFVFVRDKLISEAFSGIMLSILLALCVLTLATTNIIIALFATTVISLVVLCSLGTIVLLGWKLGVLESVGLVMIPGLAVDFVAHLAESYVEAESQDREGRIRHMLARVGISVVSGAISTLGASAFLFFPVIVFFNKFGIMMFMTIGYSLFWSMLFFPALLSTPLGPQGNTGNWVYLAKKIYAKLTEKK